MNHQIYNKVYSDAQAGGLSNQDAHGLATDHATRINHTPLPWHNDREYIVAKLASDIRTEAIAMCMHGSFERKCENALLIVRAVNSHQTLCDALQAIVTWIETTHKAWPAQDDAWGKSALDRARQALNQAKL